MVRNETAVSKDVSLGRFTLEQVEKTREGQKSLLSRALLLRGTFEILSADAMRTPFALLDIYAAYFSALEPLFFVEALRVPSSSSSLIRISWIWRSPQQINPIEPEVS